MSGGQRGAAVALATAVLALLLYLPSLRNGFVNWDDARLVTENTRIHDFRAENVRRVWTEIFPGNYYPLTLTSLALNHAIGGLDPFGYHLLNVLLHAASVALLALILVQLGAPPAAAALAACVFAIHPTQVESVAWVAERSVVLSGFFLLASFFVYTRAARGGRRSPGGLALSLALYVAALLSKVTVIAFPGILLLYDLGYRRAPIGLLLAEKAPFLLFALAATLVGYRGQVELGVPTEGWLGGTPVTHVATMADLLARYARVLLFPAGQSALYHPPEARSLLEPRALAGFALAALAISSAWRAWRLDRRALVWMGFFWLGLLPVSQIVPYTVHMADRYLYLPLVGVAAGVGMGGAALVRAMRGRAARAVCTAAIGIALAAFSLLTLARERVWRDPFTLWEDTIRKPPVHWVAWYNHGLNLDARGDPESAIAFYERALALNPESVLSLTNIGKDYAAVGRGRQAETALRRAMALPRAAFEDRARAAILLGELLLAKGRPADAIQPLQRAAAWEARSVPARVLLARALGALGRDTEARLRIDQALAIDRRSAEAWLERGLLHARAGRAVAARADLDRALELAPEGPLRVRIHEAREKVARPGSR